MKKILISALSIGVVAAVAVFATQAFFSDTETSTGNTFTAGAIDLKVSSSYSDFTGPQQGFESKDLNGEALFSFVDMKPGDMGGGKFDISATSNPYWACMKAKIDTTPENDANEPEVSAGDSASDPVGELQNYLSFYLWNDLDGNGQFTPNDISKDRNLVGPLTLADLQAAGYLPLADTTAASFFSSTAIDPIVTKNLGYKYCFGTWGANPATAGLSCSGLGDQNKAQTDGVTGSIEFYAVQSRNNMQFTCASMNTVLVVGNVLNFSSTGWGGLSCPSDHPNPVSGGVSQTNVQPWVAPTFPVSFVLAVTGATLDGFTYPVFPHYTYPTGENGIAIHNGGTAQSLYAYLNCAK